MWKRLMDTDELDTKLCYKSEDNDHYVQACSYVSRKGSYIELMGSDWKSK